MKSRKSPRRKGFDYSTPGYYFITTVTKNREELFGRVENGSVQLNRYGEIVKECWFDLESHYENIILDESIIMPNHVHGIICVLNESISRAGHYNSFFQGRVSDPPLKKSSNQEPAPEKDVKMHNIIEIVRAFKSFSARRINDIDNQKGRAIWQRSFHDYYLYSERRLRQVRRYIQMNPYNWPRDRYYHD